MNIYDKEGTDSNESVVRFIRDLISANNDLLKENYSLRKLIDENQLLEKENEKLKKELEQARMSDTTIIDEGPPDDWNGELRECDICHNVGNCSYTDDPVFQNDDDEWWCWQCWAKRAIRCDGKNKI